MNLAGLSFEALPPIDIPFRFFLSAPVFVILVAAFILYSGESLWLSRWHPGMLAITHGFTLGFIASVMMGALMQILPVVGGMGFPKVKLVGKTCHVLHLLGTLALMLSFIWPSVEVQLTALLALALGFSLYITAAGYVLFKKLSQGDTIVGIRLAVFALLVTIVLGLLLLTRTLGMGWLSGDKLYTDLHAAWGLYGWVGLLIIAVSFQIIPMFHVAPSFPKLVSRYLPASICLLLILTTVITILIDGRQAFALLLLLFNAVFAVSVLKVIKQRKRKVPDITIDYWQLSAISLLVCLALYVVPKELLPAVLQAKYSLFLAAVFIYFYVVSVIQGMLLKILPFLSYTHLQQYCLSNFNAMQFLPNMHDLLIKQQAKALFGLHMVSGIALVITILFPSLYWLFGLSLLLEFSWLFYLMVKTCLIYKNCRRKMSEVSPL